jgi:glutamine amidotransferase
MCSRRPATVSFSLEEFARHGGVTGPHKDGWGVAFYERGDVRIIKDTMPAGTSAWVRFLEDHPVYSQIVISHIRRATIGDLALANTQPFTRELGGRMHTFAHNGHMPGIRDAGAFPLGARRPVGTTDSERAFCALLARLERLWLASESEPPSLDARCDVVARFAEDIRPLGPANFLYSDSELLVAHGHRRRQSDATITPPGLHLLVRECPSSDPSFVTTGLEVTPSGQRVALFASVPLTTEDWRPLGEGEVAVMKDAVLLSCA